MRGATAVEAHPDLDYTFQSTRPVRGATRQAELFEEMEEFQSTRPVRGATLRPALRSCRESISIHAPRAGRDVPNLLVVPPALISIHAPHAGRDHSGFCVDSEIVYFNPRAPCGARPLRMGVKKISPIFQSTRPMRGATVQLTRAILAMQFQSTRPMRGATYTQYNNSRFYKYFNPRAPCGARLCFLVSPISF